MLGRGKEVGRAPVVPGGWGLKDPEVLGAAALVHPSLSLLIPAASTEPGPGNGAVTPGRLLSSFPTPFAVRVTLMIDLGGGLRVLAGVGGVSCLGMWG